MIKVFFDHQKFSTQRYGGISRYFSNIIKEIKSFEEFDYEIGVLLSQNHYLKDEKLFLNNLVSTRFLMKNWSLVYKINRLYCKYLLARNDFDIFHPTYYDPYFIEKIKKPLVITIHDMTYERLPEYFWAHDTLTLDKRLNIERADQLIAISETTKKDLLKYSNVSPDKVKVIYHGIDLEEPLVFHSIDNLPSEYFLFIGDRGGYKNFYLFLDAYKELSLKYPDLKIIVAGGGSMGCADQEILRRLKLEDKVIHLNITDQQLNYLYHNALGFVYPSLHEGFGLPILEAFKAECPVLLSDTECFREIAPDAIFFDPMEKDDLITAMEKIMTDTELRKTLIQKGVERLQHFPLNKSIHETLQLYKSMK